MIVDLLTEKIPVGLITGLVILHAETYVCALHSIEARGR